jgi:hypothetical protein
MRQNTLMLRNLVVLLDICSLTSCSCNKNKDNTVTTEIAEARTGGPIHLVSLDLTTTETITALTLQTKADGFSGTVHVKLSLNNAAVTAASLMPLPTANYTLATLEYDLPASGTVIVPLVINKVGLTVDTTYGLSFTIETVSAGTIATDAKTILVKMGLRNRWDGRYRVTGSMTDMFNGAFVFTEHETKLITTSATQVKMIPTQLGIPGYLIMNGINLTFYGNFGPVVNFDPVTNNITSVVNFYGQPSPGPNSRSAELDPSGANTWNPTTKNITIKFWMNEPSAIVPHRSAFNNVWVYLGPR